MVSIGVPVIGLPGNPRSALVVFRLVGIPLVRGRLYTMHDRNGRPQVVVVNQALARRLFADRDPLGRHRLPGRDQQDG